MADALGLSVVHLNRTLQQLRRNELIEFKGAWSVCSSRIASPRSPISARPSDPTIRAAA